MKKSIMWTLAVLLLLVPVLAMAGCTKGGAGTEELNVGFIYIGPVADGGFTLAHDNGRKAMEEKLGARGVKTHYVENVPEGAECATAIENLIKQKNCKLIFATSFGYMDYCEQMAQKYPDVKIMHCSGYKTAENMGNYFGRMYQPRYLSGMVAGMTTKTNKIGYVAAFGIPEVVRGINAFTLGVRSVNPDATVNVVWSNTWVDPAVERQSAQSLLDAGCDVMAQHQDTTQPVEAAEAAGAYSIAYHTSMAKVAPKGYLTGAVWDLGGYYTSVVESVLDNNFKAEAYWGSMKDGIVKLDDFGPAVTQEAKDAVAAKQKEIMEGSWDVFTGPIKDQSGTVRVAEGSKMTDEEMLAFDWFVEGVVGEIPKG